MTERAREFECALMKALPGIRGLQVEQLVANPSRITLSVETAGQIVAVDMEIDLIAGDLSAQAETLAHEIREAMKRAVAP